MCGGWIHNVIWLHLYLSSLKTPISLVDWTCTKVTLLNVYSSSTKLVQHSFPFNGLNIKLLVFNCISRFIIVLVKSLVDWTCSLSTLCKSGINILITNKNAAKICSMAWVPNLHCKFDSKPVSCTKARQS